MFIPCLCWSHAHVFPMPMLIPCSCSPHAYVDSVLIFISCLCLFYAYVYLAPIPIFTSYLSYSPHTCVYLMPMFILFPSPYSSHAHVPMFTSFLCLPLFTLSSCKWPLLKFHCKLPFPHLNIDCLNRGDVIFRAFEMMWKYNCPSCIYVLFMSNL